MRLHRNVLLLVLTLALMVAPLSAQAKVRPKPVHGENSESGDDFYSSARDDVSLGPRIKYPKRTNPYTSSSERYFTGGQVNNIPFSSPGEALEVVPGLAVGR